MGVANVKRISFKDGILTGKIEAKDVISIQKPIKRIEYIKFGRKGNFVYCPGPGETYKAKGNVLMFFTENLEIPDKTIYLNTVFGIEFCS